MVRRPICVEGNPPFLCTPGPTGYHDAGDPNEPLLLLRFPAPLGMSPGGIGLRVDADSRPKGTAWKYIGPGIGILGAFELGGMDAQGELILGTYLQGGGKPFDIEDPTWTAYMSADEYLRDQIFLRLRPLVAAIANKRKKGRYPLADTFHAETTNHNDFSGYSLLNGTNKDVGDFKLTGWATVTDGVEPWRVEGAYDIELDLRFSFNDIVDKNSNYFTDRVRSVVAKIFTLGKAKPYRLSIHWGSRCQAEVRPGNPTEYWGYPSARPLPKPLRKASRLSRIQNKSNENPRIPGDALFDFDSARLKPTAERHLTKWLSLLNNRKTALVKIVGHTDSTGKKAYNLSLSLQRANAVRDWFVKKNVNNPESIFAFGEGEKNPVASNQTADGRQKNRRVEINFK